MNIEKKDGIAISNPDAKKNVEIFGFVLTALVLVFAAVMRVLGAYWYRYSINPDYGIVVTMARNMAHGKDFPVFFYGQAYMGSLEPAVSALLVFLFGDSTFVICLGTALVAFALILMMRRWAADSGGVIGGVCSVLLCAVGPIAFFHYAASPRGGYMLALFLSVYLLREASDISGGYRSGSVRVSFVRFSAIGLAVGLVLWNFWLAVPAVVASGLLMLFSMRFDVLRKHILLPVVTGFVIGSLPFWVWNATNNWMSFAEESLAPSIAQAIISVKILFSNRILSILECMPLKGNGIHLCNLVAVVYLAILAFVAMFTHLKNEENYRARRTAFAMILYAIVFTTVYGISYFGMVPSLRYLLTIVPLFSVWAGAGVGRCFIISKEANTRILKRVWTICGFFGACAVLVIVFGNLKSLGFHSAEKDSWRYSAYELYKFSKGTKTDAIFGEYKFYSFNWAFEDFMPNDNTRPVVCSPKLWRYQPYKDALDAAKRPGVLEDFRGFSTFLNDTQGTSDFKKVSRYRFHYNAKPPAQQVALLTRDFIESAVDSTGKNLADAIFDTNPDSIISNSETNGEFVITIDFATPLRVAGVRLCNKPSDIMQQWALELKPSGGAKYKTVSKMHCSTGFHWTENRFNWMGKDFKDERRTDIVEASSLRLRFAPSPVGSLIVRDLEILIPKTDVETASKD